MKKNFSKPFIIGEVGINHNGSLELAKEIILLAKKSNFDAVKLQKKRLKYMYSRLAKKIKLEKLHGEK